MDLIVKDRVKETCATAGTGTLTLGGTVSGFQSFATIGNGNLTYFTIFDVVTGDWEVNFGVYSSGTLTRNAIPLSSSNAGALVSFDSNIKDVFCTYPAETAVYNNPDGSLVYDPAGSAIIFAIALG